MRRSPLNLFARLTAGAAFFLLLAGGLVTSTDSGLAVPDWPLSYGQFFPPLTGGVFFEHGHRLVAGSVGLLTLILVAWVHAAEERPWVRSVARFAAGGILLQAILGGVTVLYRLPPQISISHACLGQTVFCLLVALAQATSRWYRIGDPAPGEAEGRAAPGPRLGWLAVGAVFLQLLLGAILRHTGHGLPHHLGGALLASAAVFALAYGTLAAPGEAEGRAGPRSKALHGPAVLAAALVPVQWFLGLGAWISAPGRLGPTWKALLPTLHVGCGALILAACVVWTLRASRGHAVRVCAPLAPEPASA